MAPPTTAKFLLATSKNRNVTSHNRQQQQLSPKELKCDRLQTRKRLQTMYLQLITLVTLEYLLKTSSADCGCGLNRQRQCDAASEARPGDKYSQKLNAAGDDTMQGVEGAAEPPPDMVLINSGTFLMGTDEIVFQSDHEGPVRNETVTAFFLDKYEVSNGHFRDFVEKSGYTTEAEVFGDSFVFEMSLPLGQRDGYEDVRAVQAPWWIKMKGVTWRRPEGPHSDIKDRLEHPVVHVSWNDAAKYCAHVGKRLPTEAEWEMACRAGLRQKLYPWGNKLNPQGKHWANIWQGDFPRTNTGEDGHLFTAPVDEYPPNKFGLHNMAGNVWEWTQDDWMGDPGSKVKKGGSYLCHESYCWRYRCAARSFNTKDTTAGNLGFRCAKSAEAGTST